MLCNSIELQSKGLNYLLRSVTLSFLAMSINFSITFFRYDYDTYDGIAVRQGNKCNGKIDGWCLTKIMLQVCTQLKSKKGRFEVLNSYEIQMAVILCFYFRLILLPHRMLVQTIWLAYQDVTSNLLFHKYQIMNGNGTYLISKHVIITSISSIITEILLDMHHFIQIFKFN